MRFSRKVGLATLALLAGVAMVSGIRSAVSAPPDPAGAVSALSDELAAKGMEAGHPVFIRIFKEESELELWIRNGETYALFDTYPVCKWSGVLGPKLKEGDGQSPEGFYFVPASALNPHSRFHLSFNLGFPNAYDRAHGRTGSYLMVHGDCVSIGCYAMTDGKIEEIYGLVEAALRAGQPFVRVHVFPFRMTAENMARHAESPWADFWTNLKEGYDSFEAASRPPNVTVRDKRYHFESEET